MNEVYFHTVAFELPPTPGGLFGKRWALWHHCKACRQRIEPGDLVSHAKAHFDAGEIAFDDVAGPDPSIGRHP